MHFGSSTRSIFSAGKSEAIAHPLMMSDLLHNTPKGSIMRLLEMTKGDWIYGVGGTIGSIGAGCVNPACALLLGAVLTAYYNNDNHHIKIEVAKLSILFAALAVAAPFIFTLQHYSIGIWGEKLIKDVREKMFECKLLSRDHLSKPVLGSDEITTNGLFCGHEEHALSKNYSLRNRPKPLETLLLVRLIQRMLNQMITKQIRW
jgi:hypothetical protein